MYHYEYVRKRDAKPYRDEFLDIIHEIQNLLRDKFTFSYKFVGSSSRNMITCDFTTNKGFDFDVDFYINDYEEEYSNEDEYPQKPETEEAYDEVSENEEINDTEVNEEADAYAYANTDDGDVLFPNRSM